MIHSNIHEAFAINSIEDFFVSDQLHALHF